jgi:hypothetical protein
MDYDRREKTLMDRLLAAPKLNQSQRYQPFWTLTWAVLALTALYSHISHGEPIFGGYGDTLFAVALGYGMYNDHQHRKHIQKMARHLESHDPNWMNPVPK